MHFCVYLKKRMHIFIQNRMKHDLLILIIIFEFLFIKKVILKLIFIFSGLSSLFCHWILASNSSKYVNIILASSLCNVGFNWFIAQCDYVYNTESWENWFVHCMWYSACILNHFCINSVWKVVLSNKRGLLF